MPSQIKQYSYKEEHLVTLYIIKKNCMRRRFLQFCYFLKEFLRCAATLSCRPRSHSRLSSVHCMAGGLAGVSISCPARLRLFWSQLHASFVRSSSFRLLLITMLVMFSPSASVSVNASASATVCVAAASCWIQASFASDNTLSALVYPAR